jgi:DNA-binding Lrp family transcriptional regulator
MVRAFVMLGVEFGCGKEVLEAVKSVEGVVEAHLVTGIYDVVVVLEAEGLDRLKTIISKMRNIENVHSTLTMIAVE